MKKKCCLITGGAGFIGSALSNKLSASGELVVAIDNMHPQVHVNTKRPESLSAEVEVMVADICDSDTWRSFLRRYEPVVLVHLAAETGTGQSLTQSRRHANVNIVGLTTMLDAFSSHSICPAHILLASSRAVYGEGAWKSVIDNSVFYPGHRTARMLRDGEWDFANASALAMNANEIIPHPTSIYAATKLGQEQILDIWANAYDVPLSILRLQNVYGVGQSLINDYTGIIPLFVRMGESGRSIPVYEDGNITRDFVNIEDVVSAFELSILNPPKSTRTIDVGSGVKTTIYDLARLVSRYSGQQEPHITKQYRLGDVRHAFCDVKHAKEAIGYSPTVTMEHGIAELCEWIKSQKLFDNQSGMR